MASRPGIVLKMEELSDYEKQVSKCVIDPSFANISMRILKDFFSGWSKLESKEGIENLNTSKTVDMGLLFCGCSKLKSLDCSSFKTDNVENMSWMFDGCSGLTSLDVSGFKTDNVTDMSSMFYGCRGLTSLDVSNFNTENVKNMNNMFCDIPTLHTIYCNDSWSCDSSADMFKGCTSLVGAISYDDSKTDVIYANPTTGYFTPKSLNLGDVTGDGEVTVADAVSVVNIILSSGHTGVKGK